MDLDMKQLAAAIKLIAEEKNLDSAAVQEIVEQALAAAFRRDFGDREQEVRVTMNLNTGDVDAYISKEIVNEVENKQNQISLKEAQVMRKNATLGETIEVHHKVESFGRVAAQTAKQVILQRLREAEREIVMAEYEDKIGTLINGIVTRVEARIVRVDLGKTQAIMPASEQIQSERYFPGQRIKVLLKDIEKGFRGPQPIVSRGSADFMRQLFAAEVPEMDGGAVEIKNISREAGVRSKIAVSSLVQGVDPVGTFVGGHGTRVNAVMSEVGEQEKIDIIVWDENPVTYIENALSPTKVSRVLVDKATNKATVYVMDDQLSIAIGKGGQNVRLASKLTGFDIDIEAEGETKRERKAPETVDSVQKPKLKRKSDLENSLLEAVEQHGE
ncbi:transcription termination/antitermination protein NusA [Candidatus Saccharibacteria bacterium]|nr:MAG: transcription termination/antitermination protein NusA [Candidatus Saccharibacteria bacterium]